MSYQVAHVSKVVEVSTGSATRAGELHHAGVVDLFGLGTEQLAVLR